MVAGLLQLSLSGKVNVPLYYNPDISFFKYAYRRHTNFAIENIELKYDKIPDMLSEMHKGGPYDIFLKIANVDLLTNLYLIFKLPDIYSSDKYKFKWVENIGSLLIKNAHIYINGNKIDTITGEWLTIWNELSMPVKDGYNKMTGNIEELTNPKRIEKIYRIKNNIITDSDYISSDKSNINNPSIKSRYLSIPLPFWFSKNPNLALPILKLSNHILMLKIEFENIENLYTIYSDIFNMNISPIYYNSLYNTKISIKDFIILDTLISHIEATYIVLDTYERETIGQLYMLEYLFDTVSINSIQFTGGGSDSIRTIDLMTQLAVKEIIWTLKRIDNVDKFNDILNYSYSIPINNEKSIMKSAQIIWNKATERVETKDAFFYNTIQPYQHHSIVPKQGIYCYSFALHPEKWFPTGAFDGGSLSTQLILKLNEYSKTLMDELYEKKFNEIYRISTNSNDILCTIYIIQYNILVFQSGEVGLKFQN